MERCEKGRERESDLLLCVRLYSCMTLYAQRLPLRVCSACEAFVLCVACDCVSRCERAPRGGDVTGNEMGCARGV